MILLTFKFNNGSDKVVALEDDYQVHFSDSANSSLQELAIGSTIQEPVLKALWDENFKNFDYQDVVLMSVDNNGSILEVELTITNLTYHYNINKVSPTVEDIVIYYK